MVSAFYTHSRGENGGARKSVAARSSRMPGHRKPRQFKQTDAFTRGMVIGLKRAGWSIRQIAAETHLGASTVHRLWRRWLEQGNVAIYRNVGATRVTSARVDRRILRQAVAAPQATCTAILQHVQGTLDHSISTRTISRRLVANGLHSCRPLRRLPLTPPNRRQRLEWCWVRSTWMTEWHRVVFSDESHFCLSSDSRRVRVWRRRGERSNPAAIVERPTVQQRGIMVWGAIAYDSRSPLLRIQGTMTAQRYVDDVLRPVTLPYLQGVPNALYQQDNARPHTARISQQALQDVPMLPWPPYSPDLSPIEHVWDIIGRRLHALPQPRSEDELWQMVEREWRAIPQDAIRTLIDSLPRRVAACIAVHEILAESPDRERNIAQDHSFWETVVEGYPITIKLLKVRLQQQHYETNIAQQTFLAVSQTQTFFTLQGGVIDKQTNIYQAVAGCQHLISFFLTHHKGWESNPRPSAYRADAMTTRLPRTTIGVPLTCRALSSLTIAWSERLSKSPSVASRTRSPLITGKDDRWADSGLQHTTLLNEPCGFSTTLKFRRSLKIHYKCLYNKSLQSIKQSSQTGIKLKLVSCLKSKDLKLAEFPLKMILVKDAQNFKGMMKMCKKITDLIKENPRTTLLEIEQDTGISKITIGRIVTEDLKLKKTPAKFIPRFLTNEQKLCRLATCEDMLGMTRTDPEWKDKIITGDKTWVYGYDPETKRQSAEWRGQGEPRPKISRILKSRNKVLLVTFLDNKDIVHHEYLPAGQTVIKEMYLGILRRLREAI
ncbi:hypothetical protein LAZ67_22000686 [Cordylochernes scorpioides]|uniref:Transposase n=1 Tax=Cordylochernes scorpioides TaxID=51811 RepID=A0ABY6LSN2_9ARAC|nr:hypothetical protein LAZ67_22000686 [Cordylochernes scorpioides]